MIKKILIVDDSPVARKMLRRCMPEGRDFDIYEAGDGVDGLRKFQEVRPDLTFMDLTMPIMNGMRAIEEIKKVDSEALIIVNTADVQMKSIFKVLELGSVTVIKKPPTREAVSEAIARAEQQAHKEKE
ncbi:MAG TPA: response regulator [Deltaproteobacteria bacterium]|nr:response regulator [Deltaproteobacteria bacterium]